MECKTTVPTENPQTENVSVSSSRFLPGYLFAGHDGEAGMTGVCSFPFMPLTQIICFPSLSCALGPQRLTCLPYVSWASSPLVSAWVWLMPVCIQLPPASKNTIPLRPRDGYSFPPLLTCRALLSHGASLSHIPVAINCPFIKFFLQPHLNVLSLSWQKT